jgi:ribosomal protein RSM22 (predicted rRNA methylase)
MKTYQLPDSLTPWIDRHLRATGSHLLKSQELAKAILRTSNDYQEVSSQTPWELDSTFQAYLAYFFPLNYVRCLRVIDEALHWGFFADVQRVIDYGCGPGTASKALFMHPGVNVTEFVGVDHHSELKSLYQDPHGTSTQLQWTCTMPATSRTNDLLVASYALNEIKDIPDWLSSYDKVMILEPSTRQAFPKLLQIRQQFLERGYHLVAPCPHHHACPLGQSKKDWCHDRVHWQPPDWFQSIQKHLPIKNHTLTFSYLLASRQPLQHTPLARIVGDAQVEKGKTRWMVCQGPEREFLSFLKRQGHPPEIHRGDRVQLKQFEKRGDEIRFNLEDFKKV